MPRKKKTPMHNPHALGSKQFSDIESDDDNNEYTDTDMNIDSPIHLGDIDSDAEEELLKRQEHEKKYEEKWTDRYSIGSNSRRELDEERKQKEQQLENELAKLKQKREAAKERNRKKARERYHILKEKKTREKKSLAKRSKYQSDYYKANKHRPKTIKGNDPLPMEKRNGKYHCLLCNTHKSWSSPSGVWYHLQSVHDREKRAYRKFKKKDNERNIEEANLLMGFAEGAQKEQNKKDPFDGFKIEEMDVEDTGVKGNDGKTIEIVASKKSFGGRRKSRRKHKKTKHKRKKTKHKTKHKRKKTKHKRKKTKHKRKKTKRKHKKSTQ
jgi:hypothetical protein